MPSVSTSIRQALVVARYEMLAMLSSVRALLFVVTYGVIAGGFGAFYLWADRQTGGKLEELSRRTGELGASEKKAIIDEMATRIGRPLAEAILSGELSPLVLFVLYLSTFVIPGLVLLVGFGSIADDLHTRYARYLLQRVRRGTYLAGKLFAHFVVSYLGVIVVHVALLSYASTLPSFDAPGTLSALPGIWVGMAFFLAGYVAFTSVFSSTISPPFAAFAIGGMALLALWLFAFLPSVGAVWMGAWHMQLWALDPRALGVFAAHAVFFASVAYLGLRRRDV